MRKIILLLPLLFIAFCYAQNFEVWAERGGSFTIGKPEKIIIYIKNNDIVEDSYAITFIKTARYQNNDVSELLSFTLSSNKILKVQPNETKTTVGTLIILGPVADGSITITATNKANQQKQFTLSKIKADYPQSLSEFNVLVLIFIILIASFYLTKNKILLVLTVLLSFSMAKSSYISMTTLVETPIILNNSTSVEISVENSGDETAYDAIAFLDRKEFYAENIYMGKINPGDYVKKNFTVFFTQGIKEGIYITAMRVYYKDTNGYVFSAISPVKLIYKSPTSSKLTLLLENKKIEEGGNTKVEIKIKNLDEKNIDAKINIFMPDEFGVGRKSYEVSLKPNSEKTVLLDVFNIKALKGSTYPYFVSAEYEDEYHYSDYSMGFIQVTEKQRIKSSYLLAGVALLISIIMLFFSKKSKKRKR
jgi:hypothetical protein